MPPTILLTFLFLFTALQPSEAQSNSRVVDFFSVTFSLPATYKAAPFEKSLTAAAIREYISGMDTASLRPYLTALLQYKEQYSPDDWLYYQLVRKVAEAIVPKKENYDRYTFHKWWLLTKSGYDARLAISDTFLLFYVQSNEKIYNIPFRMMDGKQFVCLNYHDYGSIDFDKHHFSDATPFINSSARPFSYKINHLPDFRPADYTDKEVAFSDGFREFSFHIKINQQVKQLFTNYPVVDYSLQFNMPLSKPTYESLVPALKRQLKGSKPKDGVEFLMQFTRYAFSYKPDTEIFGGEKRLSPEQTLLYDYSDCEDRAALFFFLVKELYNLPMLVLTYPQHVTVAVQFDKAYGNTIEFEGKKYSLCEPSPQTTDLRVGQEMPALRKQAYEIAYAYSPH
ncbi:hypothetical protein [Flavisolibacter nicotianae]|uniref:hypothetical protein n=1 Tax=Flavisolibacter nicotianae TaxID=2364882 RepID=UPI000EB2B033|nr:hypothetical protein [Flavisolibacter nicotianae]